MTRDLEITTWEEGFFSQKPGRDIGAHGPETWSFSYIRMAPSYISGGLYTKLTEKTCQNKANSQWQNSSPQ